MGNIARGVVILAILVGGSVTADTARPAVKGKSATVATKKSVVLGGVSISFESASHKHGGDLGMWRFIAKRGAKSEEVELRSSRPKFQAEVAVHGVAFVFEHVDYEKFTITLFAQKAPKPIDEDACADKVSALAAKQGLAEGSSRGYSNDAGIVKVTSGEWTGYCGTLTKRVWIEKSAAADETK